MLTTLHLRFDCEARTPLNLGGWRAGNNLRGALGAVLRRAICPEIGQPGETTPEHTAVCPACEFLFSLRVLCALAVQLHSPYPCYNPLITQPPGPSMLVERAFFHTAYS